MGPSTAPTWPHFAVASARSCLNGVHVGGRRRHMGLRKRLRRIVARKFRAAVSRSFDKLLLLFDPMHFEPIRVKELAQGTRGDDAGQSCEVPLLPIVRFGRV